MPRSTTENFNNVGGPCDAVLASLNSACASRSRSPASAIMVCCTVNRQHPHGTHNYYSQNDQNVARRVRMPVQLFHRANVVEGNLAVSGARITRVKPEPDTSPLVPRSLCLFLRRTSMFAPLGVPVIWLVTVSAPKAAGPSCVTVSSIRTSDRVYRMRDLILIHHVWSFSFLTDRLLIDHSVGKDHRSRSHLPWLGQNVRIFHGGFPAKSVPYASERVEPFHAQPVFEHGPGGFNA